jgi:hypothetical protein
VFFFPREVAKGITTPMFILNPAYDVWQLPFSICIHLHYLLENVPTGLTSLFSVFLFRWSMSCLQQDLTLKIYGEIADWILPSVIQNSSKFSKVVITFYAVVLSSR